ncbi:MAG: glucose-6-phosphate dehydrogenase (coenzyme-F420) [Rhizobiales bacterium]|nr:glucose-6-phosphate dehydrogenase (coenzyme-F420) [Hyphomicrobiales bacterium]MBN9009601.1 glucose-6-phosphate dehydrogenase (coenzyme-F420) [Hyphomicrobiales bacterium]
MRFGYKASAEQFAPSMLLDFAVEAEATGFDSVFVSDHFQPWKHTDGHAPFAPAWMAAVLARTERIVVGTSVLAPTFRLHPSVVAHAFGTLGAMFPGRVILGVGTGESLNEVPATGLAWPELKERSARLREAIRLIRQLWREDRVSFDGEYYKTVNATIYDKPADPVPIYIAAGGPLNAKYAGKAGDGFICTSGKGASLYVDELLPNVAAGRAESALKDRPFERMIEVKVSFDTDPQRALNDTRHWAALSLSAEEKHSVEDPAEMERLAAALPIERVAKRWIVSSDPDEHVRAIRTYIDYGFDHLVFHAPGPDQSRFLQLYAREILPRLRKLPGAAS